MTALRWGSATDTGLVRRNNQDHLLAAETLFAVADGMGGHAGGEVASRVAVEALRSEFESRPRTSDALLDSVREANRAVYARSQQDTELRGMGTTLTAAAPVVDDGEDRIAIANVGDSRAYVFSQGDLTQLTEDHSVAEELVRRGEIEPEDVDHHPQRHILTRAMGIMPEVEVDLWEVLPYSGDRILLCSDGLVREVTDDQIAAVLRRLADPDEAAQELVARARSAGGSDNITVVIVDVVDDDDAALRASEALRGEARIESAGAPPEGAEGGDGGGATFRAPLAKRRRVTFRVILFLVLVAAILAGGAFALVTYARDSYYVTLGPPAVATDPHSRPLLVYKGRPGGLLWFHPTLAVRTIVIESEVLPVHWADLDKGVVVSSLSGARSYVDNLIQEAARAGQRVPAATTTTTR